MTESDAYIEKYLTPGRCTSPCLHPAFKKNIYPQTLKSQNIILHIKSICHGRIIQIISDYQQSMTPLNFRKHQNCFPYNINFRVLNTLEYHLEWKSTHRMHFLFLLGILLWCLLMLGTRTTQHNLHALRIICKHLVLS